MTDTPKLWALVELMGHRHRAGRISEATIAGATLLLVETMGEGDQVVRSEMYAPSAIYCITPCGEDTARRSGSHVGAVAALSSPRPLAGQVDYDDDFDDDGDEF